MLLVIGCLAALVVALALACIWLARRYGQTLLTLEDLESQLQRRSEPAGQSPAPRVVPAPALGSARRSEAEVLSTLRSGVAAPAFTLPDQCGRQRSLAEWRGERVLLVFTSDESEFGRALWSDLVAAASHRQPGWPRPVLINLGAPRAGQTPDEAGDRPLAVLDGSPEVARDYLVDLTPVGFLIDEHGRVSVSRIAGAQAVLALAGEPPAAVDDTDAVSPGAPDALDSPTSMPKVSVVMATRERPLLLALALELYRRQTYPNRELIVVDDGAVWPANAALVEAAGGRLMRAEPGTPLGIKLNLGLAAASGPLCAKFDDDDWYGPDCLARLVSAWGAAIANEGGSVLASIHPFTVCDVARWDLRRFRGSAGSALLFARQDWLRRRFRPVSRMEDTWFLKDQRQLGVREVSVEAPDSFVCIRHRGAGGNRGHSWLSMAQGQGVEVMLAQLPPDQRRPEDIFSDPALSIYRELHSRLSATASPGGAGTVALGDAPGGR